MLKVPSDDGPVSRLYSIASPNTNRNSFELIIRMIPGGLASNYLFSLKENTEVIFQGPAGMFGLRKNEREKIFIVTGTGIAPILSMIKSEYKISNVKYQIFWGLKNYKDVYLFNELKKFNIKICLSREQNLDKVPEVDRKYFEVGHVNSCFDKLSTSHQVLITNFDFYLCGGRLIVESLKQFLLAKGIPLENIIFEKF